MLCNDTCTRSMRCWECNQNCTMKNFFLISDPQFYFTLYEAYKVNVGMMISKGTPLQKAKEQQQIIFLTFMTSRMKFLSQK